MRRRFGWVWAAMAFLLVGALMPGTGLAAQAKTKVVWWSWAQGAERELLDKHVELFEKANPDIDVEIQTVGWGEIPNKLPVAVAGGSGPDISTISTSWVSGLISKGVLEDLSPLIERDRVKDPGFDFDDIFPVGYQMWRSPDGYQYAFPDSFDVEGIFFNVDLYEKAGLINPAQKKDWNWNDMLNDSIKFTQDLNGDGNPDQFGFSNWFFNWFSLIYANGGQIVTKDWKSALNTDAARQALQYYKKFFDAKVFAPYVQGQPDPSQLFANGKVGIEPCGAWLALVLNQAEHPLNYDVGNMPLSPAGKRASIIAGGGVAIIKGSKHVEEAWRLIKFMASKEMIRDVVKQPGAMPLRISAVPYAFKSPEPPRNKAVFAQVLTYSVSPPVHPLWSDIRSALMWGSMNQYFAGSISLDAALELFSTKLANIINPPKK